MGTLYFKIIHFLRIIWRLITSVPFLTLSFFGNAVVLVFATAIYFIEKDVNPMLNSYIDALWWSFTTTSTVGYGDIVPVTVLGKLIGIAQMLVGVAIFATYTALFARAIIDDEHYMD